MLWWNVVFVQKLYQDFLETVRIIWFIQPISSSLVSFRSKGPFSIQSICINWDGIILNGHCICSKSTLFTVAFLIILDQFVRIINGYPLSKTQRFNYAHFNCINDSTVFAQVEGFFNGWHPDGADLDPSFCQKFIPKSQFGDEMMPLFHNI